MSINLRRDGLGRGAGDASGIPHTASHASTQQLAALTRPSGAFAMVAIDQRESLRSMLQARRKALVSDEALIAFKVAVADVLAPDASAMLFDRHFGLPAMARAQEVDPPCGIILAADELIQVPGEPVTDTDIDRAVVPAAARDAGAAALKLLLLWKGEQNADRCRSLAGALMESTREAGILGIIEAMVRPPDGAAQDGWDREGAIIDAARALAGSRPDLYKCELPYRGLASGSRLIAQCEKISAAVASPWVVLSQGVAADVFPGAVEAACRGGASGFLAGRAIWADSLNSADHRSELTEVALPRLRKLGEIVDKHARPWRPNGIA